MLEDTATESDENVQNNVQNGDSEPGEPETLMVLAEEELIALDLKDENWKMMSLPYLVSLHASAITCSQYVSGMYIFLFLLKNYKANKIVPVLHK